jgi:hypothetical protein
VDLSEHNINQAKQRLARKMGKNATVLLDRLGRNKQFINAIETPVGREIISLVVETIENGVDLFLQQGLSEKEWNELYPKYLELQASLKFHNKVLKKFKTYDKDKETFNKALGD